MKKKKILSIIIPVYNEEKQIDRLMKHLTVFDEEAVNLIFVDGGSEDRTADLLEQYGQNVISSGKGRGKQLHAGALAAAGDHLLFLHADCYFEKSPLKEIERILSQHEMGAFKVEFDNPNLLLKLLAWGSNWRLKYRKIAFGDQGMFMTKDFYHRMGGFKSLPLMEDYDFSLRAKKAGCPVRFSRQKIITSSRFFDQHGVVKSLLIMQKCQHMYRQGAPIEKIQELYRT